MSTLYDLFKVKENATQAEIKEAYEKIIAKANSLPQNDKIIEQVRRIKIAYGILSNEEKRKKYDLDLATKRADALLENINIKQPVTKTNFIEQDENGNVIFENPKKDFVEENETNEDYNEVVKQPIDEQKIKKAIDQQINNVIKNVDKQKQDNKIKQRELKKQQRKNKRQAKKQQQLKREMEIQAYGEYLSNQGYKVKYPWTWLRIKRLLLTIIVIIITFIILWHVPFVRKTLIDLYNENFVIRAFVNLVISIFTAIIEGIKNIFK